MTQPGPSWIRNLTLEEIVSTIKSFPTGKAAGPDGFCSEFFYKFCGLLAPLIVRMIINSKRIASHTKANEAAILSLDAQKVFDQVEWPYMFGSLQKFCFGETLISWVKLIYARQVCSILSNTDRSSKLPLHRSVQQGCPLSPALFAIAIEPLAICIRHHKDITGLEVGESEALISLYADDVILYLKNSRNSVPVL